MVIIKRYPNRKLYDSEAKKYITLEGVAELIRSGQEVQILDHTTGEDLTAVTFTQIIFEQEKKSGGFLPRSVLTGLVQASAASRACPSESSEGSSNSGRASTVFWWRARTRSRISSTTLVISSGDIIL
jgi:polyhydroxyalkanoate synthesis repressor PhaR